MRDSDLLSEASCASSQKYTLKMTERRIHDQQQNKIDKLVKDTKKRIKERQSEVLFSAVNTPKPMFHKFQQGARKPKINTNLNKSFVEVGTPSEREKEKPRPKTPAVNRTFCTRDNTPTAGRVMGGRKGSLGTVANKPKTILAGKQKPRATTPSNTSYSQKMASKKQPSIDNTFRKGTASRMWSSKTQTKEEKEPKTEPKPPKSLNTSFSKASSNQYTPSGKKTPPSYNTPTHSRASYSKKKHNFAFSNYGTQPQSSQDVPTPEPKPERADLSTEEKTKE